MVTMWIPTLCYVDSGPQLMKYDSIPISSTDIGIVTVDIASVTANPNLIQDRNIPQSSNAVQDRNNPQTSNINAIQNTTDDSIPVTSIITVDIASVTADDPNLIQENPQSSNVDKSKKLIVDDLNRKISRCENNLILSELRKI